VSEVVIVGIDREEICVFVDRRTEVHSSSLLSIIYRSLSVK